LGNLLRKIFQNHSTRVLVLLFVAMLILIAYFLTHSYFIQLGIHKNKILSRLEAVASTAATQIDGNQLEYLFKEYPKKGDIKTNYQDRVYQLLRENLLEVKKQNKLSTDIYTLSYDKDNKRFLFGISTTEKPLFRDSYEHFPPELLDRYEYGGKIDVYEDQYGYWLSAFSPIMNSRGKIIGVVQVDSKFNEFLSEARKEIFLNIGISLLVTMVLFFFLSRAMRTILLKEDQLTADLLQSKLELEQKNQDTLDSILYAKKIQDAILPLTSKVKESLSESFVFHLPRDIVSGDFYWFKHIREKIFIASVDCTGHGVPGAFMSMIGSILLDDIISKKQINSPEIILNKLHNGVVKALKQTMRKKASKDGMDIALCVIEDDFSKLRFSGAFRPLLHISEGKINRIRSDSAPIGGFRAEEPKFSLHEIDVKKGDCFYIYSDGFADQFGGSDNKKYLTKRFREFLLSISHESMERQEELLREEFESWKADSEQVDDVLVIGFRL